MSVADGASLVSLRPHVAVLVQAGMTWPSNTAYAGTPVPVVGLVLLPLEPSLVMQSSIIP